MERSQEGLPQIETDYEPRYMTLHELLDSKRFVVVVAHRRFGKTTVALNHLLKKAYTCEKRRAQCGYIAPLRTQAKTVAWNELKRWSQKIPSRIVNESELYIDFPQMAGGNARVRLFGADNPDALRGQYFDYVVMDEVAQMRPETWEEVVRPTLSDRQGGALFIGTPNGINLFSQLYENAVQLEAQGNSEWAARCYPVTATIALPEEEIEALKREQSDNAFRQEYMCDFQASNTESLITIEEVNAAMYERQNITIETQEAWPLVVGVDVGMRTDPTVVFARKGKYAFEPIVWRELNTNEIVDRLLGYIVENKPAVMSIDVGFNPGVYDNLVAFARMHDTSIKAVHFGNAPNNEIFLNKRVEMWVSVRDWLRDGGRLPNNMVLKAELTAPETRKDEQRQKIHLEAKDEIKKRLGHSTDLADALALTFAVAVPPKKDVLLRDFDRYEDHVRRRMTELVTGFEHKADEGDIFGYKPELERGRDDWY